MTQTISNENMLRSNCYDSIHTLVVNVEIERLCVVALTRFGIKLAYAARATSISAESLARIAVQSNPHISKTKHIPAIVLIGQEVAGSYKL